jgi:hypothetical protein
VRLTVGVFLRSSGAKRLLGVAILVWIWGCAVSYTLVKDFNSRKPGTVAFLPVLNNTNDLDAPKEIRPLIYKALINQGYRVQPQETTGTLLKSQGIKEAGQIYTMSFRELGDLLKTDALLVATVLDWSTVYLVAYSSVTVEAEFRLIDAKTESVLWKSKDKVCKRHVAVDKDSLIKTLEAAVVISYSSLAENVIRRCFATLPYGVSPHSPRSGKARYRKRQIILRSGILQKP